jgi:hypothetical protein
MHSMFCTNFSPKEAAFSRTKTLNSTINYTADTTQTSLINMDRAWNNCDANNHFELSSSILEIQTESRLPIYLEIKTKKEITIDFLTSILSKVLLLALTAYAVCALGVVLSSVFLFLSTLMVLFFASDIIYDRFFSFPKCFKKILQKKLEITELSTNNPLEKDSKRNFLKSVALNQKANKANNIIFVFFIIILLTYPLFYSLAFEK